MSVVFSRLLFWDDQTPRTGPESFALDELLLNSAARESAPLLRRYHWDGHWISFGYFQRWETIRPLIPPGARAARRRTGGGIVDHAHDEPYSLLIPRGFPLASDSPATSYRRIHGVLATALCCGSLAPDAPSSAPGCCFTDPPAPGDLVTEDGTKLAGAAQRRTVCGLLHQGSLARDRLSTIPAAPWVRFADSLARQVVDWTPDPTLLAEARSLARTRYDSPEWLHRR